MFLLKTSTYQVSTALKPLIIMEKKKGITNPSCFRNSFSKFFFFFFFPLLYFWFLLSQSTDYLNWN